MIKLKGHSNFTVLITLYQNNFVIKKSSDKKNFPRLCRQIQKQIYLTKHNFLGTNIKIPAIICQQKNSFWLWTPSYWFNR